MRFRYTRIENNYFPAVFKRLDMCAETFSLHEIRLQFSSNRQLKLLGRDIGLLDFCLPDAVSVVRSVTRAHTAKHCM